MHVQDFVKSPGLESTDINDKMRLASIWYRNQCGAGGGQLHVNPR